MGWWRSWFESDAGVAACVLPDACASCDEVLREAEVAFCSECAQVLLETPSVCCSRCSEPGRFEGGRCVRCRRSRLDFDRAWAPYEHDGVLARAIHRFKYEDRPDLARTLAQLLAQRRPPVTTGAVLVPVPLHATRFRTRGFDQAALLAVALAERLALPTSIDGLVRVRPTERQVGLSELQREANLAGAFAVADQALSGKPVVLLDDVFTTGATVREAARVLRQAGASRVEVLTLARARRETALSISG